MEAINIDREQIITALTVERLGSFTRAAQVLHVTQSTVTARVHQLERELGLSIWERTTRRLVLTAAGARLMELFQRAAILFDRMEEVADDTALRRHVVLGSVHSQWSSGVLTLLNAWTKTQSGVTWRLVTGHSRELVEWVRDGSLDGAISYLPANGPGLQSLLLAEQRLALLAAPHTVPAGVNRLEELPLAFVNWGDPFTQWFEREWEHWTPTVQVDQAPLMIDILTMGGYVGFMPKRLAQLALQQGVLVELPFSASTPVPRRSVYWVSSDRARARTLVADLWHFLLERGPEALGD